MKMRTCLSPARKVPPPPGHQNGASAHLPGAPNLAQRVALLEAQESVRTRGTSPLIASRCRVEQRPGRLVAGSANAPRGVNDDRPSAEKPGQHDDDPSHDRDQPDELERDNAEHSLKI